MKLRFALPLAVLATVSMLLSSCNAEPVETVQPPVVETNATEIAFSGIYSIVRSDFKEKAPMDAFYLLNEQMQAAGAELTIKTDFLNSGMNEQPGEYELLLGPTERTESTKAMETYTLGVTDYLVKLDGTKIVLLAGSDHAYTEAIHWLCSRYDAASGMLTLPNDAYLGKWKPVLEGLTIDGTPIEQFTIVTDDVLDWGLDEASKTMQEKLEALTAASLAVTSHLNSPVEHEIILGSTMVDRDIPEGKRGASIANGSLYLTARTASELQALLSDIYSTILSEDSTIMNITNDVLAAEVATATPQTEVIKISGNTPQARGESLREAIQKIADMDKATAETPRKIIIELADGEHQLNETLVIGDNAFTELVFRPTDGATPIITGLTSIPDSAWQKVEGKDYYVAKLDTDTKVRDFYVDGNRIKLAESKQYVSKTNYDNVADRKDPANAKGFYVHRELVEQLGEMAYPAEYTIYVEWQFARFPITGVDLQDTKEVNGEELVRLKVDEAYMAKFAELNTLLSIAGRPYFIANHKAALVPGTCVSDYAQGLVYYYPESGAPKSVSYSALDQLISLQQAENVSFEHVAFTGTSCLYSAGTPYYGAQANRENFNGLQNCAAVWMDGASNISFSNCTFEGLGGNGIQSINNLYGLTVDSCYFFDVAMSAMMIGNLTKSLDERNISYNIAITNNHIEQVAMEYPSATAIFISHVDTAKILHNTIHNIPYTGISVGYGWGPSKSEYGKEINVKDVEIAYNRITDFMTLIKDGGAIYTLGGTCTIDDHNYYNLIHHNYCAVGEACAQGTGQYTVLYHDGSSSNWLDEYNVIVVNPANPVRNSYISYQTVKGQQVYNIMARNNYVVNLEKAYLILGKGGNDPQITEPNFLMQENNQCVPSLDQLDSTALDIVNKAGSNLKKSK